MPSWDALALSSLFPVLNVRVGRGHRSIAELLPLGARCRPWLTVQRSDSTREPPLVLLCVTHTIGGATQEREINRAHPLLGIAYTRCRFFLRCHLACRSAAAGMLRALPSSLALSSVSSLFLFLSYLYFFVSCFFRSLLASRFCSFSLPPESRSVSGSRSCC